jgi:hypothetical protein
MNIWFDSFLGRKYRIRDASCELQRQRIAYKPSPVRNHRPTYSFFSHPHFLSPSSTRNHVWYIAYPPLAPSETFDNTGKPYSVSKIINAGSSLNIKAYTAYSPLLLSASFAMLHGISFAPITATLTHALLYHHKRIWIQACGLLFEPPDINAHLMSFYNEVPNWWYLITFGSCASPYPHLSNASMLALGVATIQYVAHGCLYGPSFLPL